MAGGKWKVGSGRWEVEGGKWKVESGRWKVEGGKWAAGSENCTEGVGVLWGKYCYILSGRGSLDARLVTGKGTSHGG